jgi:chromosome partitioning protein
MAAKKTAKIADIASPRSTRIVAIANNKGGVGKTTTAMNLAGAFVLKERKVLAIDLDPQCNASIAFNVIVDANSPGVRHLLLGDRFRLLQCVYERGPYCDFIPADPDLAELQTQLLIDPKGRTRLRDHLQPGSPGEQ